MKWHTNTHTHTPKDKRENGRLYFTKKGNCCILIEECIKGVLFYNIYVEAIHLCNIISGGKDFSVVSCTIFAFADFVVARKKNNKK